MVDKKNICDGRQAEGANAKINNVSMIDDVGLMSKTRSIGCPAVCIPSVQKKYNRTLLHYRYHLCGMGKW